jgi:hypothetical protein
VEPENIVDVLRQLVGAINALAVSVKNISTSQQEQSETLRSLYGTLNVMQAMQVPAGRRPRLYKAKKAGKKK